jgi:hypothetical protein
MCGISHASRDSRRSSSRAGSNLRRFIENSLCQPGFAEDLSKQVWLDILMQNGCGEALASIALNPPAGMIPEARPALYERQARRLRETQPLEAAAILRKGIEICPAGADWNPHRSALKLELTSLLIDTGKPGDAGKVFATIPPEEIPDRQKALHQSLGEMLARTPESR